MTLHTHSRFCAVAVLLLLLVGQGWGATYYVDDSSTGSSSPYNSWATAATTINAALAVAKTNAVGPHTIYVGCGSYTDYPNCDDADLVGMQMLGVQSGTTTIAGEDEVVINVQAGNYGIYLARNGQTVKGLTFRDSDATRQHIYMQNGDGITVQRCYSQNPGMGHLWIVNAPNFVIEYNTLRGVATKRPAVDFSGSSSGVFAYNFVGPSQRHSSGYLRCHMTGTVGIYNNNLSSSYVWAIYQDTVGGTANISNNIIWGSPAVSYTSWQNASVSTIASTNGTCNVTNNLVTGSPVSTIAALSGVDTDSGNLLSVLPRLKTRNFSQGYVCIAIDDYALDSFETMADVVHSYGGHMTMFVDGRIQDQTNYESRINALLADGHAIGAHTWSHTKLANTNACTIRYSGSDSDPHITITAGDVSGSIALTTTEGSDDVTYNFDASSTIASWIASSAKISLGVGSEWALYNIATTPATPDYTSTLIRCTSLAAMDADLAGSPLSATVSLNKTDETTGFLKDEFVDWKADLEAMFGTVSTIATPQALTEADAIYTAIVNAGYLGCRGSSSYYNNGESFIDLREFKIERMASLSGTSVIANSEATEETVRAKARDIAAYLWDNAAVLSFYWHSVDVASLTSDQLGWFCQELQTAGIPIVTFPYVVEYLRDTANGWTASDGVWSNLSLPLSTDNSLKKGSPCINAGTNLGDDYDLDYLGYDQDVYGSGWEIGAYVYRPRFLIRQ